LGLISKDGFGNYQVSRVAKIGIISAFIFIGRFAIPKHLFYASATSLTILLFTLLFINSLSPIVIVALLPGIMASAIFWYETLKVWQLKPSFR